MHGLGRKRGGPSLLDTRIVGDCFTYIQTAHIGTKMIEILSSNPDWILHFENIFFLVHCPKVNHGSIMKKLISNCKYISENSFKFNQVNLNVNIFETVDKLSLWMELPREYDEWKRRLVDQVTTIMKWTKREDKNRKELFRQALRQSIDRLWFFATFETIRTGNGYFSEASRYHFPMLNIISTHRSENLGTLPVGESFRQSSSPKDKYEILVKTPLEVIVRNDEGNISSMKRTTTVSRESDLSQKPHGSRESKMVRQAISNSRAKRRCIPYPHIFPQLSYAGDLNYQREMLHQSSYCLCFRWIK